MPTTEIIPYIFYTDVPKENWDAAELSVQAQLLYLRT